MFVMLLLPIQDIDGTYERRYVADLHQKVTLNYVCLLSKIVKSQLIDCDDYLTARQLRQEIKLDLDWLRKNQESGSHLDGEKLELEL